MTPIQSGDASIPPLTDQVGAQDMQDPSDNPPSDRQDPSAEELDQAAVTGAQSSDTVDSEAFRQYNQLVREREIHRAGWQALEVLDRNKSLLGDAKYINTNDIQALIDNPQLSQGDRDILSSFIKNDDAFDYVCRLGETSYEGISSKVIEKYAGVYAASQAIFSDGAALDIAFKGAAENQQGQGDYQVSWQDIQSRIDDLPKDSATRRALSEIDRDAYTVLRGENPYIQLERPAPTEGNDPAPDPAEAPAGDTLNAVVAQTLEYGVVLDGAPAADGSHDNVIDIDKDIKQGLLKRDDLTSLPADLQTLGKSLADDKTGAALDALDGRKDGKIDLDALANWATQKSQQVFQYSQQYGPDWAAANRPQTDLMAAVQQREKTLSQSAAVQANVGAIAESVPDAVAAGADQTAIQNTLSAQPLTPDANKKLSALAADAHDFELLDIADGKADQKIALTGPSTGAQFDSDVLAGIAKYGILLDVAGAGPAGLPDGLIQSGDILALAQRTDLPEDMRNLVARLQDPAVFDSLDQIDGAKDGTIHIAAVLEWTGKHLPDIDTTAYAKQVSAYQTVNANAGFLDTANGSANPDGLVGSVDIAAGAASVGLVDSAKSGLAALSQDSATFDVLDLMDGADDNHIDVRDGAGVAPDVREAQYGDGLFAAQKAVSDSAGSATAVAANSVQTDAAVANALDRLDGSPDGQISTDAIALPGKSWSARSFDDTLANDGSGQSVRDAAIGAVVKSYEGVEATIPDHTTLENMWVVSSNSSWIDGADGTTPDGLIGQAEVSAASTRAEIPADQQAVLSRVATDGTALAALAASGGNTDGTIHIDKLQADTSTIDKKLLQPLLTAQYALAQGVKVDGVDKPLPADFFSTQVLDAAWVNKAASFVLADPAIGNDLNAQLNTLSPDAAGQAEKIFSDVTSPYYTARLNYMERNGQSAEAAARVNADLAALHALDPAKAEQASEIISARMAMAQIAANNIASISPQAAEQAVSDAMDVLTGLRLGRSAAMATSGLATTLQSFDLIRPELARFGGQLTQISRDLCVALRSFVGQGGSLDDVQGLLGALDRSPLSEEIPLAGRKLLNDFVSTLNRKGVWVASAGVISAAAGVYGLATLDGTPESRLSTALSFTAAASYSGGLLTLGSNAIDALAGTKFADGFARAANTPFFKLLTQEPVGSLAARNAALAFRGLASASGVASGVLLSVLGGMQFADGIRAGDAAAIVPGAFNIAAGGTWVAAASVGLVSAELAGPLILGANVLAIVGIIAGLIAQAVTQPNPSDAFADGVSKPWQDAGLLQPNGRDSLKVWYDDNHTPSSWNMVSNANERVALNWDRATVIRDRGYEIIGKYGYDTNAHPQQDHEEVDVDPLIEALQQKLAQDPNNQDLKNDIDILSQFEGATNYINITSLG